MIYYGLAAYEAVAEAIEHKNAQKDYMKGFIRSLENTGSVVQEFDEGLWSGLVQEVEVQKDGRLRYRFKNGAEITV